MDSSVKPTSHSNPFDIGKLGQKQVDAFMVMQRELSSLVEEANRSWLARADLEKELVSELISNLSKAKMPIEAAKAYQDWMGRRMRTLAQDGQKLFADGQKFVAAATRFLSNGQKSE
jgi:hypothetical protein